MLSTVLRHAGGIRVDHVLGLFRLWWVPAGNSPRDGAYVTYDHDALIGILALEAQRAGAVVIGEDLGTFEPWVRDYLAARGILGTSILWFENDGDSPAAARKVPHAGPRQRQHPRPAAHRRLPGRATTWRCAAGWACWNAPRRRSVAEHTATLEKMMGLLRERGLLPEGTGTAGQRQRGTHHRGAAPPAGPDAVGPARRRAGGCGGGAAGAEPARHHRGAVPELAGPAGRSGRKTGVPRRPSRQRRGSTRCWRRWRRPCTVSQSVQDARHERRTRTGGGRHRHAGQPGCHGAVQAG